MGSWFENSQGLRIFQDILDISIVAFLIYNILRLIKGTRTVNMVVGLAISILIYYFSSIAELYTLNWILYHFLESLLLIIVILFQNEIRRFLTRIGQRSFFSLLSPMQDEKMVDEIVRSCILLANKRIGGLIVIEKEDGIGDYVELGTYIDAVVSRDLLSAIFSSESTLHDGAVMIQKGRVSYASCFLPLSMNPNLDSDFGTRHRAGIGLSEETDALVIIVSEQNGWISVATDGKIIRGVDGITLRSMLNDQLKTPRAVSEPEIVKEEDHHETKPVEPVAVKKTMPAAKGSEVTTVDFSELDTNELLIDKDEND